MAQLSTALHAVFSSIVAVAVVVTLSLENKEDIIAKVSPCVVVVVL